MATIQGVYVALFGRPADPVGLAFFSSVTGNGQNLAGIGSLQTQPEFTTRFAGQSNSQIIASIYQSLFNRAPDAAGQAFFAGELAAGRQSANTIAINILDGARGSDMTILNTKLAAADAFTAQIDTAAERSGYTGTAAAVSAASFLQSISTNAPTAGQVSAAVSAATSAGPGDERQLDSREAGYYDGNDNNTYNEDIAWNSDNGAVFRDVVYGDGGYDYISTGGGNDKIVLGSNLGTWPGAGNEFGNAAIADGGAGNDTIYVRGAVGAFHVITGEGQDQVVMTGPTQPSNFVRINASDIDTLTDKFTFGPDFNGTAEIGGADNNDVVQLEGGDWRLSSSLDGVTYRNSTGGSVKVTGVIFNYNDPDVIFV